MLRLIESDCTQLCKYIHIRCEVQTPSVDEVAVRATRLRRFGVEAPTAETLDAVEEEVSAEEVPAAAVPAVEAAAAAEAAVAEAATAAEAAAAAEVVAAAVQHG